MPTTNLYFGALASVAFILLWGVSLWNGTVTAMVRAAWVGQLDGQTALRTSYTGFFPVDFVLSLLVAFFFYGTNGSHPGFQLFLVDAYATLQVAFVWLYIEGSRAQPRSWTLRNPVVFGLLWQGFGAAIALPLYFMYHLRWQRDWYNNNSNKNKHTLASPSLEAARALPFAFLLGAVLPAVVGMLPTWYPSRDAQTHQVILAVWQLDPIYVSVTQTILVKVQRSPPGPATLSRQRNAAWWVRFCLVLAAGLSAMAHIYTMVSIAQFPSLGFASIYVPNLLTGPPDAHHRLANGPWLFLQYDLIIITTSCLSWAFCVTEPQLSAGNKWCSRMLLGLGLIAGTVLLGAGSVVSLVLFFRETSLQQQREAIDEHKRPKRA
ncbi:hypothetical protein PG984_012230 [Apiospora sp. TS-2023a]